MPLPFNFRLLASRVSRRLPSFALTRRGGLSTEEQERAAAARKGEEASCDLPARFENNSMRGAVSASPFTGGGAAWGRRRLAAAARGPK